MAENGRDMLLKLPSRLNLSDTSPRRHLQSILSPLPTVQSFGGLEKDFQVYPSPPMSDSSPPLRRPVPRVEDESLQAHSQPRSAPRSAEQTRTQPTILPAPVTTSGVFSQTSALIETVPVVASDQHGLGLLPGLRPAPSYRSLFAPALQTEPIQPTPSLGAAEPVALPAQLTPISGHTQWRTVRPARRAKAHVASACVNCKRAHLSCDVQRPCSRCIAGGKEATCFDVQHKKRGRPRLREERPLRSRGPDEPISKRLNTDPAGAGSSSHISAERFQGQLQQPFLSAMGESVSVPQSGKQSIYSLQTPSGLSREQYSNYAESKPFCLLDLDFSFIKSNKLFETYLHAQGNIRGRPIAEFLDSQSRDLMQSIKVQIHKERSRNDPAYLPPIRNLTEHETVQSITQADLGTVTSGFSERNVRIVFSGADGQSNTVTCQIRLAKTNVFFVVLIIWASTSSRSPLAMPGYPEALSPSQQSGNLNMTSPSGIRRPSRPISVPSPSSASQHLYQPGSSMSLPLKSHSPPVQSFAPFQRPTLGYYQNVRQSIGPGGVVSSVPEPFPFSAGADFLTQTTAGDEARTDSLQNLHLPPILGPNITNSPTSSILQSPESQTRSRQSRIHDLSVEESADESSDRSKKRRLNIHEVLE